MDERVRLNSRLATGFFATSSMTDAIGDDEYRKRESDCFFHETEGDAHFVLLTG